MRYRIVPVKNVTRLSEAGDALINRGYGMPGMGLIYGATGYGKTTAATWFVNHCHGVYVRAMATTTPSSLLGAICKELDLAPMRSCAPMTEAIVERLAQSGRPLFVDESDYLADSKRMTETLRDLHDMATVPVILIGMAGIQRKLAHRQQLAGRLAQWVEFAPCDYDDARLLASQLSEVTVADDLLQKLHRKAGGSVRLLVVGLGKIEHFARARGLDAITAAEWRGGDDFFIGSAPKVASRGNVTALGAK